MTLVSPPSSPLPAATPAAPRRRAGALLAPALAAVISLAVALVALAALGFDPRAVLTTVWSKVI